MPRRTGTQIKFGLEDVSAKTDSMLSVSDAHAVSNVEQIEQEDLAFPNYATCELNFWMLDGASEILPDETEEAPTGWWSAQMSDSGGALPAPPVLTISFTQQHSSVGLTFTFYHTEWPTQINVKWYRGETLLSEKDDAPDGAVYSVENAVENYTRIVATFYQTNHPFRYLKLTGVQYGITQIFDAGSLMSAALHEEINPISEEISINTVNFKVHSSNAAFSIINPTGIYAYLQQKQELTVTETVDGAARPMGTFYLNEWSGENENTFVMSAIDAIGVMDGTQYMGGLYDGVSAGEVIGGIMESAGFKYELEPELAAKTLTGWLPILSHREALQQAAFALCAIVDTSRSDLVKIYRADESIKGVIARRRKFTGSTVTLRQFITGVEVSEHNYTQTATASTETLYEGILPAGRSVVTFSSPAYDLSVTGAALETSHVNYAVLNVPSEQTVTVTGKSYADTIRIVGRYMSGLPAGEKQNVLTVEKATLVSRSNSAEVARHVYDYHQRRIQQNFTMLQDREEVGGFYSVETLYEQSRDGLMESSDIDLTGGFLSKVTVTGN